MRARCLREVCLRSAVERGRQHVDRFLDRLKGCATFVVIYLVHYQAVVLKLRSNISGGLADAASVAEDLLEAL